MPVSRDDSQASHDIAHKTTKPALIAPTTWIANAIFLVSGVLLFKSMSFCLSCIEKTTGALWWMACWISSFIPVMLGLKVRWGIACWDKNFASGEKWWEKLEEQGARAEVGSIESKEMISLVNKNTFKIEKDNTNIRNPQVLDPLPQHLALGIQPLWFFQQCLFCCFDGKRRNQQQEQLQMILLQILISLIIRQTIKSFRW